ncbi:MAG: carbohydrate deacetylase [Clostridia bacterium]|jgi:predicted glycoside hydrolase/deacetylase ChbG (UPF0249 family)|nr:carbohydrate deacetylase [Clostridia bacterium]
MKLIINSDDFGLTKSINKGILQGMKEGIITSTSIMMNMPGAEDAIEIIKANNLENIGIHINLTVGKPLRSDVESLVDETGKFYYRDLIGEKSTYEDAKKEMKEQIESFLARGLTLDHLDNHHDLYKHKHLMKAMYELAKEYNLPMRTKNGKLKEKAKELGIKTPDFLFEKYMGENISVETLKEAVSNKQFEVVEIMTHSGYIDDEAMEITSYNKEREKELATLIEAKKQGIFEAVELISFYDLNK